MASACEVGSCCSLATDTREKPYQSGFTIFLVDLRRGNSEGKELGTTGSSFNSSLSEVSSYTLISGVVVGQLQLLAPPQVSAPHICQ